jgi:subtilisin family serine protease
VPSAGAGILVAVVDTGGPSGWNTLTRSIGSADDNGHGTFTASVVRSICSTCTIMSVKVLGASGEGNTTDAASGVRWAVRHRARIINLSLSSPTDDPDLDAAIADAVKHGVTVVIAAGNGGTADPARSKASDGGGFPAAASSSAIRVGAVTAQGRLYPWSNRGPWVDTAAPGSLTVMGASELGTSVSAPYVAGIAGLLLTRNPRLTPAKVKALIDSNGVTLDLLDVASGGRVNAAASLAALARSTRAGAA